MPELGILFTSYFDSATVRRNLESFRRMNPDSPIIHGIGKDCRSNLVQKIKVWRDADLLLYDTYESRTTECNHWFYAEWDTYCNIPLKEYLKYVTDFDVSASQVKHYERDTDWRWFRETKRLPRKYRHLACGVMPLCGTTITDKALKAIIQVVRDEKLDAFCELRLGTAARIAGFMPVPNPLATGKLSHRRVSIDDTRTIFHSVKEHTL